MFLLLAIGVFLYFRPHSSPELTHTVQDAPRTQPVHQRPDLVHTNDPAEAVRLALPELPDAKPLAVELLDPDWFASARDDFTPRFYFHSDLDGDGSEEWIILGVYPVDGTATPGSIYPYSDRRYRDTFALILSKADSGWRFRQLIKFVGVPLINGELLQDTRKALLWFRDNVGPVNPDSIPPEDARELSIGTSWGTDGGGEGGLLKWDGTDFILERNAIRLEEENYLEGAVIDPNWHPPTTR